MNLKLKPITNMRFALSTPSHAYFKANLFHVTKMHLAYFEGEGHFTAMSTILL